VQGSASFQISDAVRNEIDIREREYLDKYFPKRRKLPDSWSGKTLRDRAEESGLFALYLMCYTRQSDLIHGGPSSHTYYLDFSDPSVLSPRTESDWDDLVPVTFEGCLTMFGCLERADEDFSLSGSKAIAVMNELLTNYSNRVS